MYVLTRFSVFTLIFPPSPPLPLLDVLAVAPPAGVLPRRELRGACPRTRQAGRLHPADAVFEVLKQTTSKSPLDRVSPIRSTLVKQRLLLLCMLFNPGPV